jgi:hypothetical protein
MRRLGPTWQRVRCHMSQIKSAAQQPVLIFKVNGTVYLAGGSIFNASS